jgi:hypothetical protein
VEFLSDDQVAAYERFVGDLSRSELEGFFLLDSTALDLIARKRGAHNRLGAGLQIGTVRYLGHFLTEAPRIASSLATSSSMVFRLKSPAADLIQRSRLGSSSASGSPSGSLACTNASNRGSITGSMRPATRAATASAARVSALATIRSVCPGVGGSSWRVRHSARNCSRTSSARRTRWA